MKENLKFAFHVIFHPFDGYWDMTREKKGHLWVAFSFVFLLVISDILVKQLTAFLFNPDKLNTVDIVFEFLKVVIVYFLFCAGNWSVTTLMSGEGSFRDILMAVGYATLPLSMLQLPVAILSNLATYTEEVYINAVIAISWIWFFFLLFIGIMTIHQYSIGKMLFTVVLTVVAMAAIIFVYLLMVNLFTQLIGFVSSVYKEIALRL